MFKLKNVLTARVVSCSVLLSCLCVTLLLAPSLFVSALSKGHSSFRSRVRNPSTELKITNIPADLIVNVNASTEESQFSSVHSQTEESVHSDSEQTHSEKRHSGQRHSEQRHSEETHSEQKHSEQKHSEERHSFEKQKVEVIAAMELDMRSNPLWEEQCATAAIRSEAVDIEAAIRKHAPAIVTRWFNDQKTNPRLGLNASVEAGINRLINETRHGHLIWGRERLDSLLAGAGFAEYFDLPTNVNAMVFSAATGRWEKRGKGNATGSGRVVFFRNFKAMSSSITAMMTKSPSVTLPRSKRYMFQTKVNDYFQFAIGSDNVDRVNKRNGVGFDYDCGFTFVRHPIDKLLSGYGEIESHRLTNRKKLGFTKVDVNKFNGLAETNDSDLVRRVELRFASFVEELLKGGGNFIRKEKLLNHVATASGHRMSLYAAWRIDFIGKMEQFASDWQFLTHSMPQCAAGFNQQIIDSATFKVRHDRLRDDWSVAKAIWRRVLESNQTMYDALVDYYIQDFVCYNYSTSHSDWLRSHRK